MPLIFRIEDAIRKSHTFRLILLELLFVKRINRVKRVFIISLLTQFAILLISLSMADVANIESDPLRSSGISLYSFGLTGLFATSYGQYYFSWDAPHFSLLFTSPLRIKKYIKSKLLFIMIMTFLPATVLVPALLITDSTIIKYYLCFLVYNAGTAPLIVVYIALFNYRKIKIDAKGVFSNYEGVGKSNLLIGVLLCILPVLGLTIALAANAFKWYYAIIFFTGLVNIFLIPLWGRKLAILFLKKKYKFLHHFTESND